MRHTLYNSKKRNSKKDKKRDKTKTTSSYDTRVLSLSVRDLRHLERYNYAYSSLFSNTEANLSNTNNKTDILQSIFATMNRNRSKSRASRASRAGRAGRGSVLNSVRDMLSHRSSVDQIIKSHNAMLGVNFNEAVDEDGYVIHTDNHNSNSKINDNSATEDTGLKGGKGTGTGSWEHGRGVRGGRRTQSQVEMEMAEVTNIVLAYQEQVPRLMVRRHVVGFSLGELHGIIMSDKLILFMGHKVDNNQDDSSREVNDYLAQCYVEDEYSLQLIERFYEHMQVGLL